MIRAEEIQLISKAPSTGGIFDERETTLRTVMAEARSIGMREMYTAMSQGLNPSITFTLTLAQDYNDERELLWNGKRYKIIRTYVNGDGIELTCERVTDDV